MSFAVSWGPAGPRLFPGGDGVKVRGLMRADCANWAHLHREHHDELSEQPWPGHGSRELAQQVLLNLGSVGF